MSKLIDMMKQRPPAPDARRLYDMLVKQIEKYKFVPKYWLTELPDKKIPADLIATGMICLIF